MRHNVNGEAILSSSDQNFINGLLCAYQAQGYDGLIHHLDEYNRSDLSLVEEGVWTEVIARFNAIFCQEIGSSCTIIDISSEEAILIDILTSIVGDLYK